MTILPNHPAPADVRRSATETDLSHPVQFRDAVVTAAAGQPGQLDQLIGELARLAEAAQTDHGDRLRLQQHLHWLHYGSHEPSYPLRQWLASTAYGYFEQTAERSAEVTAAPQLTMDDFVAELGRQQRELSPLHHPLFQHCYSDDATLDEIRIYLRHKWIIMLTFWRSLSDFGARLQRDGITNTALVYENVHEELGSGDVAEAHLEKHYKLLRHIGVDVSWNDQPEFSETYEYINFRVFCMRNADTSWGLGSFYSQEATSLQYTLGHYHQLRRLGVDHDHAEIYHAHDEIDAEHTDEIVTIIRDLVHTGEQQAVVLAGQRHQMTLWNAHFDRVFEQIKRIG